MIYGRKLNGTGEVVRVLAVLLLSKPQQQKQMHLTVV